MNTALYSEVDPSLNKELREKEGSMAYLISIDGKIRRELSTVIQDRDEIFFFTPLGGG